MLFEQLLLMAQFKHDLAMIVANTIPSLFQEELLLVGCLHLQGDGQPTTNR